MTLEVSGATFFNFHKVMTHLGLSVTKMGKSRVRANIHKITLLVIKVINLLRRMCHSAHYSDKTPTSHLDI